VRLRHALARVTEPAGLVLQWRGTGAAVIEELPNPARKRRAIGASQSDLDSRRLQSRVARRRVRERRGALGPGLGSRVMMAARHANALSRLCCSRVVSAPARAVDMQMHNALAAGVVFSR
jgi:hypothetical protein